jgi:hypothetical protein
MFVDNVFRICCGKVSLSAQPRFLLTKLRFFAGIIKLTGENNCQKAVCRWFCGILFDFQSRRLVTVMPRADAVSSECSQRHLPLFAYSGCRIGVRHDGYREPRLQLKGRKLIANWKYD